MSMTTHTYNSNLKQIIIIRRKSVWKNSQQLISINDAINMYGYFLRIINMIFDKKMTLKLNQ